MSNYHKYICGGVHCKCMNLDGKCENFHNGDHTCPTSQASPATPVDNNLREQIEDILKLNGLPSETTHVSMYDPIKQKVVLIEPPIVDHPIETATNQLEALITQSNNAARIDELSRVSNARGLHAVTFNYITKRVAQLQATEGRSETDSDGKDDLARATNELLDRLKEGMGEILVNQPMTYERMLDLLDKERERL